MSGLYNNSSYFSPARAASPQIRSTPEIDRYVPKNSDFTSLQDTLFFLFWGRFLIRQPICFRFLLSYSSQYLTELLAEHQKLTPFMQVLPICSRLLNQGLPFFHSFFLFDSDLSFHSFGFLFSSSQSVIIPFLALSSVSPDWDYLKILDFLLYIITSLSNFLAKCSVF